MAGRRDTPSSTHSPPFSLASRPASVEPHHVTSLIRLRIQRIADARNKPSLLRCSVRYGGKPPMRQAGMERELIGRMQAGDPSAVTELASTYGPRIHQLAFRYMKNWEDAEEVTQDVLLKVHRKIDAFRGDAALSSWIYRITFNTAMSRLRTGRQARAAEATATGSRALGRAARARRRGRPTGRRSPTIRCCAARCATSCSRR